MNKQDLYKIIKILIEENIDHIELNKDLIKEAYKGDERKLNFMTSEFEEGIEMPFHFGGCPSLRSMEYRYEKAFNIKKEDKDV